MPGPTLVAVGGGSNLTVVVEQAELLPIERTSGWNVTLLLVRAYLLIIYTERRWGALAERAWFGENASVKDRLGLQTRYVTPSLPGGTGLTMQYRWQWARA